jgi:vitamin B12 transporter
VKAVFIFFVTLILAVSAFPQSSQANEREDSSAIDSKKGPSGSGAEAMPKVREQIVVTASALPETIESTPAAVTVVTRKEIEENAARDLADVLREVPGVTVSRTGSPGRATSLFTRGAASTHTLVLWNGVEINNPYFAGYDWGRFSSAGVEQIEVVRGPYSALYGSDAVAGVVNVLTTPTDSGVRGELAAGSHGLRNGNVTASYVNGANVVSGTLERRDDHGFARNDDFSQNSGDVMWRWSMPDRFSLGISGRATSYDLGIPTNLNADATALVATPFRRQTGNERQIAIPLAQTLGAFSYDLTLSESRRTDDFADPDDPYGTVSGSTRSVMRRVRLTTKTVTGVIGTVIAGAEVERARVDDLTNYGRNLDGSTRREHSFFVEDRLEHSVGASRLELSAGGRYDDFDTFGQQLSPRLAAAWIAGAIKMRAAFGEAFRAPSIGELYYPFSGNRLLRPERSRSFEIGFDHGSGLSATLFRSSYRDLITFDNATYAFANVGRAEARGVEVAFSKEIANALRTSISYTYLDRPLPRRPRHSGSLFVGYRIGNADWNAVVMHSGVRDDILPVYPFSLVSDRAYTTLDLDVQVHLARVTPYVKLENATNTRYEEVRGYPSPTRRAVVGLRFAM